MQKEIVERQNRIVNVYAGPIFYRDEPVEYLGPESDIAIPHAFFKLVIEEQKGGLITALPFVFPHYTSFNIEQVCDSKGIEFYDPKHLVTVDELEEITGLDFLLALSEGERTAIGSVSGLSVWESYYELP